MTSYFELTTPTTQAFSFRPVLDDTTYNVTVPWSLFGQRYYVTCQTLSGDLVFNVPLIGSPSGQDIYSLSWEPNTVTVTTSIPHGFKPGTLVNLTIAGVLPASYDGLHSCLILNQTQFTYSMASNPGAVTATGSAFYNINLAAGYFTTSTLVYRAKNQSFEVNP